MDIALWVIQILLGLAFFLAGIMKTTQPIPKLATNMGWVNSYTPPFVRFIGVVELLGGIGLIVPAVTKILPWLTPVAAGGLAVVMVGAVVYHIQHKENAQVMPSLVLLILSVIVLVGRWLITPF